MLEQGKEWKLYGKTGWQNAPGPGIGCRVGWVEKDGDLYAFALSIDIGKPSDALERTRPGKAVLKLLGVI